MTSSASLAAGFAVCFLIGSSGCRTSPVRAIDLGVADCDDVDWGSDDSVYFACHSPSDLMQPEAVRGRGTAGPMDGYALRFDVKPESRFFATRIGGSGFDAALRVIVNPEGAGFSDITGLTASPDFENGGTGTTDAFWMHLAGPGAPVRTERFGGSGDDVGNAIALMGFDVFVGGTTSSPDFPGRKGRKPDTDADAFVCRMRPTFACVVFGGSGKKS